MTERREKRKRWVQPGGYAVEVEVEAVYPAVPGVPGAGPRPLAG
jgi:hypothetical protein